ncbi:hypothetical protein [Moorena sp. SIO3I6]|uniref:hypothetical protein n=1 Tax=Moorena sp. SIO3I6 TaxID=2607831 RepID=UPI0013F7DC83|nr:hypothetical protein [Moorena sp. SIO3I6]NEP26899.1 hypothetical protein [Moorena sp. SIO3I6]
MPTRKERLAVGHATRSHSLGVLGKAYAIILPKHLKILLYFSFLLLMSVAIILKIRRISSPI